MGEVQADSGASWAPVCQQQASAMNIVLPALAHVMDVPDIKNRLSAWGLLPDGCR